MLTALWAMQNEIVNQNTPIQLARGSQQLTGMLYSTQIDLDLDPLHHFPPGSWPCAPGTPQGQNAACAISPREQHGFRIRSDQIDISPRPLRAPGTRRSSGALVLVLVRKKPPLTPVLRRAGDPRIAPVRVQRRVGVCSVSTECTLGL